MRNFMVKTSLRVHMRPQTSKQVFAFLIVGIIMIIKKWIRQARGPSRPHRRNEFIGGNEQMSRDQPMSLSDHVKIDDINQQNDEGGNEQLLIKAQILAVVAHSHGLKPAVVAQMRAAS